MCCDRMGWVCGLLRIWVCVWGGCCFVFFSFVCVGFVVVYVWVRVCVFVNGLCVLFCLCSCWVCWNLCFVELFVSVHDFLGWFGGVLYVVFYDYSFSCVVFILF